MTALRRGLLAAVGVAALGEAVAIIDFLSSGRTMGFGKVLELGLVYVGAFQHAPVDVTVGLAAAEFRIGVALLLGTGVCVLLLYRAGRASAGAAPGGVARAALLGAAPALPYSLACFAAGLVLSRAPLSFGVGGATKVSAAPLGFLLWPLAIAGVSGALGGISAERARLAQGRFGRATLAAFSGGRRAFAYALVLVFGGLVVVATVKPATQDILFPGLVNATHRGGAIALAHNVLALPNEAVWALVPAMGGCDGIYGGGVRMNLLCYRYFPSSAQNISQGVPPAAPLPPIPLPGTAVARVGYFLFLLVPAAATVLGGSAAASANGGEHRSAGAAAGALGGVFFALLVGAAAMLSAIAVHSRLAGVSWSGWIGPQIPRGTLIALAWGIGGGAVGGALRRPTSPAA